jgi:hypothetical protein
MGVGELNPKGLQYISQHLADASHQEASMPEINTRFLFTLALEIQVSSLGDTPYGRRRMFHFDGGSFDGPKLNGKVLPGGGGWSLIRRDDVMEVDARETSSEKYSWMNCICSIASGSLSANARTLDVFQVL